jgi:hypothetical protein
MSRTVYLSQMPEKIEFNLNYSDGSGPKLNVSLSAKGDILIRQHEAESIILESKDVDWLRDVLQDLSRISNEKFPEEPTPIINK